MESCQQKRATRAYFQKLSLPSLFIFSLHLPFILSLYYHVHTSASANDVQQPSGNYHFQTAAWPSSSRYLCSYVCVIPRTRTNPYPPTQVSDDFVDYLPFQLPSSAQWRIQLFNTLPAGTPTQILNSLQATHKHTMQGH